MRRFAGTRLPADAAKVLGLAPRERVLAWSPLVGGGVAAATVTGLHVHTPQGRTVHREWSQVLRASWDSGSGTLAVAWGTPPRELTPLEMTAPGRFPEVVHERVRSSVLLSREVRAPAGGSVWVALRRTAGGDLVVQAVPAPGVRLDDPVVEEEVRRAGAALRDEASAGFGTVRGADPA